MLPHVRVRLDGVDLVDGLQVLVCPHVAAGRGGPRGGQRVVGDPLGALREGQLAVRRVHDLVRVHGLDDAAQLDAAAGRARVRQRRDLVAHVHARGQAVRGVELAHAPEREGRHRAVGARGARVEARQDRRRLEPLRHVDVVVRCAGHRLEPAVPVLSLRVQQGEELEQRRTLRATHARREKVVVLEEPLDRVRHIHPPRLGPARQRHGAHPVVLREQVAQHRLRRVGCGRRVGWLLRLRPLPQRLQHVGGAPVTTAAAAGGAEPAVRSLVRENVRDVRLDLAHQVHGRGRG
mmetsp:Transcript_24316/g.61751  ORF Transcript_24316/g.61751 Transcript_24316/m.61751 type:complete len:292 (+) Transcript_24316:989-1864(+)